MRNRYFADISSNNGHVDMAAYAAAGHIAIAIKATEGEQFIDPDHTAWTNLAHSCRLAVIHYHFGRPDTGSRPEDEAAYFLGAVNGHTSGRDFYVLDLERGIPGHPPADPAWSRGFDEACIRMRLRNLKLYASRSVLQEHDDWLINGGKAVWDADWSTAGTWHPAHYRVFARQYTDGHLGPEPHSFAGIGPCDGNRLDPGFYAELLRTAPCHC